MRATNLTPILLCALVVVWLAAAADLCFGQAFTANLSGIVTDPQNAVIPNVAVEIRNTATGEVRSTSTGPEGRYVLSQLLPGAYDLTAKATGFKTFVRTGITLLANRSSEFSLTMQVGDVAERVEVTESAVLLDTESANKSVTLNSIQVRDLPLSMRTPLALVTALAGTTQLGADDAFTGNGQVFDQQFSRFGMNGGRGHSNLILVDGATATAGDWNGLQISPIVDDVQEMQIVRNTYDAQFGKYSGGVVSIVTRGGSKNFHGSVWEFFRNDNLDANTWANNRAGRTKSEFKRNQFGANVGGPIWKSKNLFFLAGYEGFRQTTPGSSGFRTVPTELERQGDFSQSRNRDGSLAVVYNPFTTRANPAGQGFIRDAFPNNRIPREMIDAVGAKVVTLYPAPNLPGDPVTRAGNYFQTGSGKVVNDKIETRVDWAHNAKHTFYTRASVAPRQNNSAPLFYRNGYDFPEKSDINPRYHVSIGNTFVPNPTWVINVLLGSSRWREAQISPGRGLSGATAGFPESVAALFHANSVPQFNLGGYATLGNPQVREFVRYTHELQANVTKEMGLHSIKFGFIGQSALINNVDRFAGIFNFGRGMTSGPIAAADSPTAGNSVASLLLGAGASGNQQFRTDTAASLRYYGWYAQDTWRVTKRLTLTAGLRYEVQPGATERFNRLSYLDPGIPNPIAQRIGRDVRGGISTVTGDQRGLWDTDWRNLAPRFSLAYKITDKLVVRSGYGIIYQPATAMFTFDPMPGFTNNTQWSVTRGDGFTPDALLRNPFPQGLQPASSRPGLDAQVGGFLDQAWLGRDHPTGYVQHYSLDFQYELGRGSILEVGYSGYGGRRLLYGNPQNGNQIPTQFLSLGSALDQPVPNPFFGLITFGPLRFPEIPRHRLLRPFPQYDGISVTRSVPGASANYNAFTAKYTRQFSGGLTLISSYQFSKAIDNGSEDFVGWGLGAGGSWRDAHNKSLERSISAHDIPQSFVTNFVYELPVGKGKKFGSDMPAAGQILLGGWQVSGILRFQSGLPVPLSAPNPNGAYGFQVTRPDVVTANKVEVSKRVADPGVCCWFNPAAFAAAAPFTVGNSARYLTQVRSDHIKNVDFSLSKSFQPIERAKLQFRADFINLFNTPQFGGVQAFVTGGQFGRATGAINLPRQVQLGLKVDF